MLDKDLIAEIKNSVNIVDVIGEVVSLTKAGRNYLGLCPFHGEKTPSFNVVEDKQFYHCFGCGKSGDVFKFIEEYRGLSFMESVAVLAERSGIALAEETVRPQTPRKASPHQGLYDIHQAAADFYHTILMTTKLGQRARSYLHDRGLTDEIIRHFQLGLAPREGDYLYRTLSQQFDEQTLLNSALFNPTVKQEVYDAFQDRIMFPLADEYGRIIAFSGRIWTEEAAGAQTAKYKNSRASLIFNKSYELYHLDQAKAGIKKHHEVYIMEGFMDVIAAYRAGIDHAVASMGTALTQEHVRHLARFTKKAVLVYDGDKAGQAATAKALEELQDFAVEIVKLPDQMDPDDFIQKNSAEAFRDLLTRNRISPVEFLIHYLKPDNLDNLQAQIAFVEQMAGTIAQSPSVTAQNTYIHKLADLLPDFDYSQVETAVNQVRQTGRQQQAGPGPKTPVVRELPLLRQPGSLLRAENQLLNRMAHKAYVLNTYRLRDDFRFVTPELQTLFELLLEQGEITPYDVAQLEESVQQAWYLAEEENLPDELGPDELEELERSRDRELLRRDNRQTAQRIREQTNAGDEAAALEAMAKLIAQKRNME